MIVIHEDIRVLKFCNRGGRAFFARHGLNWQDFVKNGIDAEILLKIDDAMAHAAVDQARRRIGDTNGR